MLVIEACYIGGARERNLSSLLDEFEIDEDAITPA